MEEENAFVLVNNPPTHPSGSKKVMSEIHVEVNKERSQASQEERRSEGRRGRSHATRNVINAEVLRRNQKIERLERELRELKDAQASCDQQRSRKQRLRSHSGSCGSSHHVPKRSEDYQRAQKSSRRSRPAEKTKKTSPVHKPENKDHNPIWNQLR
jgi:TolA-binding protein